MVVSPADFGLKDFIVDVFPLGTIKRKADVFEYRLNLLLEIASYSRWIELRDNKVIMIELEAPEHFSQEILVEVRRRFITAEWFDVHYEAGFMTEEGFVSARELEFSEEGKKQKPAYRVFFKIL